MGAFCPECGISAKNVNVTKDGRTFGALSVDGVIIQHSLEFFIHHMLVSHKAKIDRIWADGGGWQIIYRVYK